MTLTTMYPGKINSPQVTLTTAIDEDDTIIVVTGDVSKLPAAPNLFVLGTGEDAETVYYPTDAVTNTFADVTRGFQGTAKAWDSGTPIARLLTAYDYDTLRTNILDLEYNKIIHIPANMAVEWNTPESATIDQVNLTSYGFPITYGIFQAGEYRTVEKLCFEHTLDAPWDGESVTAQIESTIPINEAADSVLNLYIVRIPDDGDYDVDIPLVASMTVSHTTAYKKNMSAVTDPFEITGTGNKLLIMIKRSSAEGDTLTTDEYFRELTLILERA